MQHDTQWMRDVARECRTSALVLMEVAKEVPEFKDRLFALADSWLTLAALAERFSGRERTGTLH
jgi:hypothetical protein